MLERFKKNTYVGEITHVWAFYNGKIEIRESIDHEYYHEVFWGDQINNEDFRGYFYEDMGVISCHGGLNNELIKMLEKAFDNENLVAIYYKSPDSYYIDYESIKKRMELIHETSC